MSVVIESDNLVKHFGRGDNIFKAVEGVSFYVEAGEIHGFLGPNGAGKSTTIKMLVGALNITSGKAWICGKPAGSPSANALIGYASDHPKFYDMPLFDYLVYMGRLGGLSRTRAEKNTIDTIQWLDLEEAAFRKVNGFSAGMRQKAGLAQALIHEPEVVILDEPTANLDPIGRSRIIANIMSLARERDLTVLISSHVLAEVEKMADRVTIITKGKVVLTDSVKNIKNEYSANHYMLEIKEVENMKNLARTLMEEGVLKKFNLDPQKRMHITTDEPDELCKTVPKIVSDMDLTLLNFSRMQFDLESIFMRAVGEKGDDF